MKVAEDLKINIQKAIEGFTLDEMPKFSVESSNNKNHGDYSSNVALVLAKKLGRNPMELAEKIVQQLKRPGFKIAEIKVAPPGFINFYLFNEFFVEQLKNILKDENFGKNKDLKNQKIVVEYTDPNPFKEFHIGHLMSNSIGESLSRIIEWSGAKVKRANYQGDVGIHVAKAIYAKRNNPDILWSQAYALGTKLYKENEYAKKEIIKINKKVYDRSDKEINKLYDSGKKETLADFEKIYKKVGTKFNYDFSESEVAGFGKKVVGKGLKEGIFEKGDKGAIIFKGENYGLHTRVFVNSEDLPTYEAKELALAKIKYDKYKYDTSIIITGNEINAYFEVLLLALKEVFPNLADKTVHIGHGMMRLPEGKMSSRTGNVITFEFLLKEVEKLVSEKLKDRKLSEKEKEEIKEKVAIGALKYSILKQSIGSDIIYDFEKSISFAGDSGPYLQYSLVRANSVFTKVKEEKVKASFKKVPAEIGSLEKLASKFPEVVEKAGHTYEPHFITLYLTELASAFNSYYAGNKIVDKNDTMSPYRVALTKAFSIIMKNGLWLLGIPAPEKM